MSINPFDPLFVVKSQAAVMQATEDAAYQEKLARFNADVPDWQVRALEAYWKQSPLPPAPQPPTKLVYSVTSNGVMEDSIWRDPNLSAPTLVIPKAQAPSKSIAATANVPPDRIDQILAMLVALNAKLDALGGAK